MKSSYRAVNVTHSDTKITATLLSSDKEMISPLYLIIYLESEARVRLKILDPNEPRYEVPYPEPQHSTHGAKSAKSAKTRYKVEVNEKPFSVQILRVDDGTVIFNTASHQLVYQDQLLSIGQTFLSHVYLVV